MSNQFQVSYLYRKWQKALDAVKAEAYRLRATKGQAVIGPENPKFVSLVMHEIECEEKYKRVAGIPDDNFIR